VYKGKTIQMASFIGYLNKHWQATPSLVVVPKSTAINWLREFARWAPELVVAPFFGEKASRDIMREYEVFHDNPAKNSVGIKFNVLVTTYETITNPGNMSAVFNKVPRWELLVVDEGQKCKILRARYDVDTRD
jgi:chromodomain-helicase-DNA-binding protein 4